MSDDHAASWGMDERTLVSGNGGDHQGTQSQFPPLARQGSYNLTLDEVQSQLGNISKPLDTIHLDEFLKNVISVEEGQLLQNPSSSSSLPTSFFLGNFNLNGSTTLSKKTVDEVWKEIFHEHVNSEAANKSLHQRLIGETTTTTTTPHEHFLVRAGVINAHPIMTLDQQAAENWFQFQVAAVQQQMTMLDSNLKVCESSVYESSVVNLEYSAESSHQVGMSMPIPAISAASSSESQAAAAERKRSYSDEMKEKTIERRQKRMIKNRESAARSRARKQAYTNQLEAEVKQLQNLNNWLKKQKEVETILSANPSSMPKYQLRRTSSTSF